MVWEVVVDLGGAVGRSLGEELWGGAGAELWGGVGNAYDPNTLYDVLKELVKIHFLKDVRLLF